MPSTPSVSVVVPTYGGARRLPVLLAALAAQSEPDLEVVVVVDGVVDDTEAVLRRDWGVPIRPIVLPQNRGRSTALNAGFDAARGEVLVRCDDDLEPPRTYVAAHLAAHRGPTRGVVGVCRNVLADTPFARCWGWEAEQRVARAAYSAAPGEAWRFWGGNVSVTRETWQRIGGYDAATFQGYGWEDVEWGYRLHRAGIPVVVDPDAEVRHHVASVSVALRARRALHSGAAQHRFLGLHPEAAESSAPGGVWGRAVSAVASVVDEDRLARAARGVDRALPLVPRRVGRKMVALVVESAGEAGRRRPDLVLGSI